jgi:hypothetical protein
VGGPIGSKRRRRYARSPARAIRRSFQPRGTVQGARTSPASAKPRLESLDASPVQRTRGCWARRTPSVGSKESRCHRETVRGSSCSPIRRAAGYCPPRDSRVATSNNCGRDRAEPPGDEPAAPPAPRGRPHPLDVVANRRPGSPLPAESADARTDHGLAGRDRGGATRWVAHRRRLARNGWLTGGWPVDLRDPSVRRGGTGTEARGVAQMRSAHRFNRGRRSNPCARGRSAKLERPRRWPPGRTKHVPRTAARSKRDKDSRGPRIARAGAERRRGLSAAGA